MNRPPRLWFRDEQSLLAEEALLHGIRFQLQIDGFANRNRLYAPDRLQAFGERALELGATARRTDE
jgi:hypothetical protein